MSNSKWVKLLKLVASISTKIPRMDYKLVYGEEIFLSSTEQYEEYIEKTWFIEPLIYKEIEWAEFPFNNNEAAIDQKLAYLKTNY